MLQVGLIGLGEEWELRFRPALARLRERLEVRSVYAAVGSQAAQAAAELRCDAAPGLVSLIEREDVRAVLVLETDWHADIPARLACQRGKPAFVAARPAIQLSRADLLLRRAAEAGVTLMPDLGHRYTPATSRLRELMATRLGRPAVIEILAARAPHAGADGEVPGAPVRDVLAAAIDWCASLAGTVPTGVAADGHETAAGDRDGARPFAVEFRRPSAGGEAPRARIVIHDEPPANHATHIGGNGAGFLRIQVQCEKGSALLEPPCGITWEAEGHRVAESLTSDRAALDVMLDHFSRRVLGGLIPVPSLDDVRRARELAERGAAPH